MPQGGPDGGDGGRGGDVWLRASRNVASLLAFRDHPHRKAGSGTHGSGKKQHGVGGKDLEVDVPEGTVVYGPDNELLADLVRHGDRWLAARGGQGGRGNARFLSNARRAPSFAEQGEYGEERWLRLELKLLADAALIGFPNAGKSTLISAVSAAKPKIANYPFTTLEPHLGVVRWRDHEFVLADMPGSDRRRGRGARPRAPVPAPHRAGAGARRAAATSRPSTAARPTSRSAVLLDELRRYRPDLLDRPRVVVGSKADVATESFDGLAVSAVTRTGLDEFARAKSRCSSTRRAPPRASRSRWSCCGPPSRASRSCAKATQRGGCKGRPAERAVALADITTADAIGYVQQRLRRMGVERALAKAGARDGDIVRIGDDRAHLRRGAVSGAAVRRS